MSMEKIKPYLAEISPEWNVGDDGKHIYRTFLFPTFLEAIEFVKKVAELAEREDHHPDIDIRFSKVILDLMTHAIGGLSENDFIMAAKVDKMMSDVRR